MNTGIIRLSLVFLCLIGLSSCSGDAAEHRFDDYRKRLERSLKLDTLPMVEPIEPARRPRKRDLVIPEERLTISMLDFLKLHDCALHEVIGERNSVLGKVAPASQRVFNSLSFLQLAPACLTSLRADDNWKLADTLSEAVAAKREGLPTAIANATLASDEFAELWRIPGALENYPANTGNEMAGELQYISSEVERWLSGHYEHDPERFETALGNLRYAKAGHLLAAAALTQAQFKSANNLVQTRLDGRPICFNGKPSNQGRIFRRVIDKYFIGDIQVWLSRLNTLNYDLMTAYRSLETHLGNVQTPAYEQWRNRRDEQLSWLTRGPMLHVKAVQPILSGCGLAPQR